MQEMNREDRIYRELQVHLDRQSAGFPSTRSGAELRVLKHIFTPFEAKIATCLTYRPEPLETIFRRAGKMAESTEQLSEILDGIEKKGGIASEMKADRRCYFNIPLVVGMYEYQIDRLSPEFIKDFEQYISGRAFGIDFLSTELPQMRTIPVAKSIPVTSSVSTFDEAVSLLKQSGGPFVILACICRKKKGMKGKSCRMTDRTDTCLAVGNMAQSALRNDIGRQIDLQEAVSILRENQKEGLVLQPSNTRKAEFICSCCGCCCGMLAVHRQLPKPVDFWASNYFAVIDDAQCKGCGTCEKRCQVNAVSVAEPGSPAIVDLNRCIGCGLCVPACPEQAVTLEKKPAEQTPPESREALYDTIMEKKKGKIGKLKLTGKLIFDSFTAKRSR